jgi:hypothetical protein
MKRVEAEILIKDIYLNYSTPFSIAHYINSFNVGLTIESMCHDKGEAEF